MSILSTRGPLAAYYVRTHGSLCQLSSDGQYLKKMNKLSFKATRQQISSGSTLGSIYRNKY